MKNQILAILGAFAIVSFAACEKNTTSPRSQSGSEAVISLNECVEFTDFGYTVCYEDVNEYRCPCNVDCFWEGAIDAALHVTGSGIDTIINLTTNSNPINLQNEAEIGGHTFKISEPLPNDCNDFGNLNLYKLTVEIL